MKRFMAAVGPAWTKYWLVVAVVAFVVLAAWGGSTVTQDDAKEANRQLKRIADSLEIIAGQKGTWRIPK